MTTRKQVEILSVITTRDESGKHFMEVYNFDDLLWLLAQDLIEVHQPVHPQTGITYSQEYWAVSVTPKGREVVEANPEYQPE